MTDPDTRERQSQVLRAAAQDKRAAAVARTAGVSINFLYTNRPLRARIESLRARQREATHPTPEPPESDTTAIVRVLTAKLKDERRRHREEVTALPAELAAIHGALLQQRRTGATV